MASQAKQQKRDYTFAVGRRREAVARVRIYDTVKEGLMWKDAAVTKGEILVNQKPISAYFSGDVMKYLYSEPFRITNTQNKFTVTARVTGGGPKGQLGAVVAGISNALSKMDTEKYRPLLKKKGLLTRDPRVRERRKVGTGGKARRAKQSPKR